MIDRIGALVGIVTRADLLKVFLRDDDEIRFEILDQLAGDLLRLPPGSVEVDVRDGGVVLRGHLPLRRQAQALRMLVDGVEGVVTVEDQLRFDQDDSAAYDASA